MRKLLIFFILILILSFEYKPTLLSNLSSKTIQVEVKGELENPGIFTLDNYCTVQELIDLLDLNEQSDISHLNALSELENKQVIVIRKVSEVGCISINSANLEELMELPGIGEVTALKIIDYRNQENGFKTLEEIMKISGIKEARYEKIRDEICL